MKDTGKHRETEYSVDGLRRWTWPSAFWIFSGLLLPLLFALSFKEPSETAVRHAQSLLRAGFFVIVLLWVAAGFLGIRARFREGSNASPLDLSYMIRKWIWRVGLYLGASTLISWFGDDIFQWGRAHPEDAWAATLSALLLGAIVLLEQGLQISRTSMFDYRNSGQQKAFDRQEIFGLDTTGPVNGQRQATRGQATTTQQGDWEQGAAALAATEKDLRHAAAHEAGHALVACAGLRPLPEKIRVTLVEAPSWKKGQLNLGGLSGLPRGDLLMSSTFARWYMMLLLSGRAAEETLFPEATLGSESDNEEWTALAKKYLANRPETTLASGEGGRLPGAQTDFFFSNPKNSSEAGYNAQRLGSLWTAQRKETRAFMDANKAVLEEIAQLIRDRGSIGRDELVPFISRTTSTKHFPGPISLS